MSLQKRGSVWWIDFATPGGERVRRSTQTGKKAEAQELHDRLKSEVWRRERLGVRPKRVWNDAAVRWLREQAHKATINGDRAILRWLDQFLANRDLESINRALIDAITEAKQADGCANATVNRMLSLVRAILRKCTRDWEWLDRAPSVRLLKEPTRRIRFLTPHQANVLLRELPPHLRDMASFSLQTGLRAANVTGLTWEQVDLSRKLAWIHPDQAKARRAIAVPLNGTAMQILRERHGVHATWVFTYEGERIHQVSTRAWYLAMKRAGIENFRWHDLRHTWASWHVQNGTPLFALQELGGWETAKMVRRYAHLNAEHVAPFAANTEVSGVGSTIGFSRHSGSVSSEVQVKEFHGTNTAQPTDVCGTVRLKVVKN